MTGWISENDTRHIPEDELHAYLDQALSRSQAAEIECHLAECRRCQVDRDRVAALRDRITALLADAAPRRISRIPAFELLVKQHEARVSARQIWIGRVRRYGALAAGLVAAVTAGWWTQARFSSAPAAIEASAELGRTLVAQGPVQILAADSVNPVEGPEGAIALADASEPSVEIAPVATTGNRRLGRLPADRPIQPAIQVTSVAAEDESFVLPGMWQSLDWQVAIAETGGNIPRIEGLPILDIQLQRGGEGERPIVVVSQQHPSGRIVKTVEGPMDRITDLLERQAARSPNQLRFSSPEMTPPDYLGDGSVAGARRGLRILSVIGPLPADSLNAMAKSIEIRE